MKPIKSSGRLKLNKETLRQLSPEEMQDVGGASFPLCGGFPGGPGGFPGGPGGQTHSHWCNPDPLSQQIRCPGPTNPF